MTNVSPFVQQNLGQIITVLVLGAAVIASYAQFKQKVEGVETLLAHKVNENNIAIAELRTDRISVTIDVAEMKVHLLTIHEDLKDIKELLKRE